MEEINEKFIKMSFVLKRFFVVLWSYIVALGRLFIWTLLTFLSGLQRILFTRSEVVRVELRISPLRCDIKDTDEKLAYIDKLCLENPDLIVNKIENEMDLLDDWDEDI